MTLVSTFSHPSFRVSHSESLNHAWSKIRAEDTHIRVLALDEKSDDSCSTCVVKNVRGRSDWEVGEEMVSESKLGDR